MIRADRHRLPAALVLLTVLCAACSDAAPPPPAEALPEKATVVPIRLDAANLRRTDDQRVIDAFRPPLKGDEGKDLSPWQVSGGRAFATDHTGGRGIGLVLQGRSHKEVLVPGAFDPHAINQVIVRMTCSERETARVLCRRSGRPLKASRDVTVEPTQDPQPVVFDLPNLRQVREEFDQIVLELGGQAPVSVVYELATAWQPMSVFVPDAQVGDELVEIAGELRRGVGLSTRRPLFGEVRVERGMELAFSYGSPEDLRVPEEAPVLEVSVLAGGGRELSERFRLERNFKTPGTWHAASLDLAQVAGQDARVRISLSVEGEHEGFCIVAEPRLRRRSTQPPSVLLITSDTHRGDHLGAVGGTPLVETPALDALAARGVLYEDCYSSTNVTNPSHIALMTAAHPRDTHIVDNHAPLIDDARTLAERFHQAGFRTFAAMSAHHLVHAESGLGQGFDRMSAPSGSERTAQATLDVFEGWLEDAAGEPLFAWVHVFDAHAPYEPPAPYHLKYYVPGKDPFDPAASMGLPESVVPPFLVGVTDVGYPYAEYRAEVDYLDSQLARLLDQGRFRDGIVAFTADHGESFGQHGVYWDHAELYPDTIHVPLILSYPGAPAGTRVKQPVLQTDVGRTLLDLAGLTDLEFGDRDLHWVFEEDQAPRPRYHLSAHGFSAALNSGPWHLILHLRRHHQKALLEGRERHQVELYDLRRDPGCEHDLVKAGEELDRARKMRAKLVEWLLKAQEEGWAGQATRDAAAEERLAQLGYATNSASPSPQEPWFEEGCTCEWCQRMSE